MKPVLTNDILKLVGDLLKQNFFLHKASRSIEAANGEPFSGEVKFGRLPGRNKRVRVCLVEAN